MNQKDLLKLDLRKCYKCKKIKELSQFSKDKNNCGGYHYICLVCDRIKSLMRYRKVSKTPRIRFNRYKYGAKIRNLKWDLGFQDFMDYWQKPCYYCGDKIETIGLDRINNKKGYFKDNLVSCCERCNMLKGGMSQNIFIYQCGKIADNLKNK